VTTFFKAFFILLRLKQNSKTKKKCRRYYHKLLLNQGYL